MPATEQTWYDTKRMHVLFGVSAVALFIATLWMLVADHNRPWKEPQRQFRVAEARFLDMQALEQKTGLFTEELERREDALSRARQSAAPAEVVSQFRAIAEAQLKKWDVSAADRRLKRFDDAAGELKAATEAPLETEAEQENAEEARSDLIAEMQDIVKALKYVEDTAARDKKAKGSLRDAARSEYEIAIRDSLGADIAQQRLAAYETVEEEVAELDRRGQEVKAARNQLEALQKQVTKPVEDAEKALNDHKAEFDRLHKAERERAPNAGKSLLEMPILDAFNSPLRPHQIWLPELKIKYPLNEVARFDRCMTCHQGMDKTVPGSTTEPAFPRENRFTIQITPAAAPQDAEGNRPGATFEKGYGLQLAEAGLLDEEDVTAVVFPHSIAAQAGMRTADVIASVGGAPLVGKELARRLLIDGVNWDNPQPITMEIRRGLPHPFSAHPRLDLIGPDSSPHPFGKFGCTICHEGQGTATAFQHAEHSPNTVAEENRWRRDYKWYENHYWDWPQRPKRFVESSCLKCHHDVVELKASPRYPEPPAPKVTRGYDLVREYGCFGCHEVKGYAGPDQRIGPDLRVEPDYYAWAILLKQQIAPRLAELRPKVEEAAAAEMRVARQRDEAIARKNEAQGAMRTDEAADLDAEIGRLNGELKKLTNARLAAERPLNELTALERTAELVRVRPEDARARAELAEHLVSDANRGKTRTLLLDRKAALEKSQAGVSDEAKASITEQITAIDEQLASIEAPSLAAEAHGMAERFKDIETPGTMRKVGPSLRYVGAKLDAAFLHDWIANPKNFRPTTKMPRVFGQAAHLDEEGRKTAERFEEVEIQGIVAYLLDRSQPYAYIPQNGGSERAAPQDGAAEGGGAENGGGGSAEAITRGRNLFVTRGCVACHSISEIGDAESEDLALRALASAKEDQGPDLSKIGAKLMAGARDSGRDPQKWLYTWLRDPSRYHARTKMPNMKLDPVSEVDAAGKPVMEARGNEQIPRMTDPAADIAAFLLSLEGWAPKEAKPVAPADVDALARQHLVKAFRESEVDDILRNGLRRDAAMLKGDEVELAVGDSNASPEEIQRRKLLYVGRRAISKYGCFGCHDVPGYEDAKPIGTGLADWGRKETDKLAFEQIAKYVGSGHGHGGDAAESGHGHGPNESRLMTDEEKRQADNHEYFHHQLLHGSRAGFAWQKLREPRSYDYKKTETKTFNEWLRMPQFTFPEGEDDIEAVIAFVLGLVADPPAPQYVYSPAPEKKAIVEGLAILEKYNCAGCHVLSPETITVRYEPSRPGAPSPFRVPAPYLGYDFMRPQFTPEAIAMSLREDYQGKATTTIRGLRSLGMGTSRPREYLLSEDGQDEYEPDPADVNPRTNLPFMLWEPALIDGKTHYVNTRPTNIPTWLIDKQTEAWGGVAARLMMPLAFEETRVKRPDLTGNGTWAVVPPPLMHQGAKTQSGWLADFLLDPHPIRPAVVLRMPKFNMSESEAEKLAAYFAAVDGVDRGHQFDPGTREEHLVSTDAEHPGRLADALKVVAQVCSQCHLIGDFDPAGPAAGKAPNLERIHKRMRREYLRPWLADPPSIIPYTNMPVNFPHDALANQALYEGTSREQLEAVTDFLLNYDQYMKNETRVSRIVEQYAPPPMAEGAGANPPATNGGAAADDPPQGAGESGGENPPDDGNEAPN